MMNALWQDVKFSARTLVKNPGFTFIAVLALALGVGANTAIFSVVNAMLLRGLPYEQPERLVLVWQTNEEAKRKLGSERMPVAPADFVEWRAQSESFERVAAFARWDVNLIQTDDAEKLNGVLVTSDFFPTLRVKPALGRTFAPEEDRPKAARVAMISYGLWRRRFNGDSNVIGRQINLSDVNFTIVGVLPEDFRFAENSNLPAHFKFTDRADVWTPFGLSDETMLQSRGAHNFGVVARLKDGATVAGAQAELETFVARYKEAHANAEGNGVEVVSLREQIAGKFRPALLVLLGTVAFVLLIACANVANLSLARAMGRRRELAIRSALGATRGRIIRQLLIESLLLALAGGACGALLAWWGTDALLSLAPDAVRRAAGAGASLNLTVLLFTLLLSLVTGIGFGLVPAFGASKSDLNETLKESARGTTDRRALTRSLLVVSEIALSLVLLVGAGLLIKSFVRLMRVEPGFEPSNVLTMDVALPYLRYKDRGSRVNFLREMTARIKNLPGVEGVGINYAMPLNGIEASNTFSIEGRPVRTAGEWQSANLNIINEEYFRALEIPVLRGRAFTEADGTDAPPVAVIDESLRRTYFADEDPLGKRIAIGGGTSAQTIWMTVVGVVGSVRNEALQNDPRPAFYVHYPQMTYSFTTVAIRSKTNDAASLAHIAQTEIKRLDKDQPVANVTTLDASYRRAVAPQRFNTLLVGVFAALALLLAVVGIYGVISYSVAQRTHEIGIRMALGAQTNDVLRLIIRHGFMLTAAGVLLGLAGAFMLSRLMASLLYEVSAADPLVYLAVAALLTLVAVIACYVPARRATKVDPMVALRYE